MQALEIARAQFAHCHHKQSAIGSKLAVDHWRGSDTNLRHHLEARAIVRRCFPGAQQGYAPKHIGAVRVECIDAVMLGRDKKNVQQSFTRNGHASGAEWLRIDFAIHIQHPEFSELGSSDVGRCEDFFVQLLPRLGIVVVIGEHIGALG